MGRFVSRTAVPGIFASLCVVRLRRKAASPKKTLSANGAFR